MNRDEATDKDQAGNEYAVPQSHLIERLGTAEEQLAEWHRVFGHLSTDADTAGNILYEQRQKNEEQIRIALDALDTILGLARAGRVATIWDIASPAIRAIRALST